MSAHNYDLEEVPEQYIQAKSLSFSNSGVNFTLKNLNDQCVETMLACYTRFFGHLLPSLSKTLLVVISLFFGVVDFLCLDLYFIL